MKKLLFIALTILATPGCAHSDKISLDPALILSWSDAKKDSSTAAREVLYRYEKSGKVLFYLAAGHGTTRKSKTFDSISYVFNNENLDVVIVEGFKRSLGYSPEKILKPMLKGINGDFYPGGESSFLVVSSDQNEVPFVGGEPDPKDVLNTLLKKKFTVNDYIFFLFLRALPQRIRSGELAEKGLQTVFTEYMSWKKREFNLPLALTLNQFKSWYLMKQKKIFSVTGIEPGETAPIENGKFFTHNISSVATRTRDESILATIEEMLTKHDTVFIAYGSSHFRIQHLALRKALGEPQILKIDK